MVKLTIDGEQVEAKAGEPLVEVISRHGVYVPHLCYIDGLPPYAGCRTCLVEIEGARGLQLSCSTKVAEGMVVSTTGEEAAETRKAVMSIILANHSDRCLTCHRRVKCLPGDICLRDDVVTHRCVTCSKNYRCELQTSCELVGMASYEPWAGEERTYYQAAQPEPDRANPFLEFDPQMCIICTRCVRACDDLRHTGAITLAGRGYSTRIEFGIGGPIQESNCDFCGACIDVCPTATLMEKPNKWIARTDDWVSTACNSCSVGCTLSMGVRNGKVVIVKPDPLNPVSREQICVRGRYHYDAVRDRERLSRHLVRRGAFQEPASWEEALEAAAEGLARVRRDHGSAPVAVLVGGTATNEEAYLAQKLARHVLGTPHIDGTAGPVSRAVARAVRQVFGAEALPSDMTRLAQSKTALVVASDLESSHNVAALRVKDAIDPRGIVPKEPGRLVLLSPRWGELADFAEPYDGVWLQPRPGYEAATLAAIGRRLLEDPEVVRDVRGAGVDNMDALQDAPPEVPGVPPEKLDEAVEVLRQATFDRDTVFSAVYAPDPIGAAAAAETARAVANLAVIVRGPRAAQSLCLLPTEANAWGLRDMGAAPDVLPGLQPAEGEEGLDFNGIVEGALAGRVKALLVVGDNPLLWAPARRRVREALEKLDCLVVIDSLPTETARLAHVVLADVPTYGKDGTYTTADRRVVRLQPAMAVPGEARPAWESLYRLGQRLAEKLSVAASMDYSGPAAVMDEIAFSAAYAGTRYSELLSGQVRVSPGPQPGKATLRPIVLPTEDEPDGALVLTTGRTLYTSLEGASIRSPEADKLHREEFVELNPADAEPVGIRTGDEVMLTDGTAELRIRAALSAAVPPGVAFVPLLYDGGAVTDLFPPDDASFRLPRVRVAVPQPA